MRKRSLSAICGTLVLVVVCLSWFYASPPRIRSAMETVVASDSESEARPASATKTDSMPVPEPPNGYGQVVSVRESSSLLGKSRVQGLLAAGVYDGRIVYSVDDARYAASGLQWPWNNVIEIVTTRKGKLEEKAHAVFRDKYDFAFHPFWSKSGKVLFSVGQIGPSSSADYVEWDVTTNTIRPVAKSLISGPITASPDGRFYAYVEANSNFSSTPSYLRIRDMKTGKIIKKYLGLDSFPQMSWLSSNVLLFNMREKVNSRYSLDFRDAIWQIDALSGLSEIFRKNAFSPTVSPDGQWFSCLSYDNPSTRKVERARPITSFSDASAKPPKLYLVLSSADQNAVRVVTDTIVSLLPNIVWASDSKSFAVYETSQQNSAQSSKSAEEGVRIYDVKSQQLTRIGKLQRPPQNLVMGNQETVFCNLLNFTKDGKFLLFSISDFSDKPSGTTLVAFDTKDGTTQTWFYAPSDGLSWQEN